LQPNIVDLTFVKLCILLDNLRLKYYMVTPSGCTDIGIRKFEFVDKTQLKQFCKQFCINLFPALRGSEILPKLIQISFLWKKMIIQPVYKMIYISCEFYYEHLTVKQHVDCKGRNSIHGTGIKYFVKKNTFYLVTFIFHLKFIGCRTLKGNSRDRKIIGIIYSDFHF